MLSDKLKETGKSIPLGLTAMTTAKLDSLLRENGLSPTKLKVVGHKTVKTTAPRKTQILTAIGGGYSYENNASKSNSNRISDSIATASGNVLIKSPIGPDQQEGTISLYGGATSVRYSRLTTKSFDSPNIGFAAASTVWKTPDAKSSGTTTRDILAFALDVVSVMKTTYASSNATLFTPSFSWTHANMPLSDEKCVVGTDTKFCDSATAKLTLKHTTADAAAVDNTSARFEASYTRIFKEVAGLSFTLTGGIQDNRYVHIVGGRTDFISDIVAKFDWAINPNVTLTGSLKYTYQRSSVTTIDWDGFAIGPQLKLSWIF